MSSAASCKPAATAVSDAAASPLQVMLPVGVLSLRVGLDKADLAGRKLIQSARCGTTLRGVDCWCF